MNSNNHVNYDPEQDLKSLTRQNLYNLFGTVFYG